MAEIKKNVKSIFIKVTIKDIAEAIKESNEELAETGTIVNLKDVHPVPQGTTEHIYLFLLAKQERSDYRRPV